MADYNFDAKSPQDQTYRQFLASKVIRAPNAGINVDAREINPVLFDWQREIVQWAAKKGRAALFQDCGLGKTFQQIEWARLVAETALIVAPLSVSEQTIRLARQHLDLAINRVRKPDDIKPGLNITNYEIIRHFAEAPIDALVLDESSILKSIDGETRKFLLSHFRDVPYRLCCTATPCPNDIAELANHAEFLGVMTRQEMLASFFVHDDQGWRVRGHARRPFYRWLSSWAMAMKSPADLGYDASGFNLPPLHIHDVVVDTEWRRPGHLFPGALKGITDRASVRKQSVIDRVARAAAIANQTVDQVIVWCGLNVESKLMTESIPDAIEVSGEESTETKERKIIDFVEGRSRVLVTKLKIAGFGMNFQNANHIIFVGLNDSYESYYQGIRRCWRYGQTRPVNAYVVVTDHETEIVQNVRDKEAHSETITREIIEAAKEFEMEELGRNGKSETIETTGYSGDNWILYQGDCVAEMRAIADESVDLSVFSPPFLALYTYSATEMDIGNCRTDDEFFEHFRFVIDDLLRITKPGRLACVHTQQVCTKLVTDGVIGLRDFRGRVCEEFVRRGWIYHGEVCIDKDPQAQAIRTHSKGLLFVQLKKDASWLRPALADYILIFRKPGENAVPIRPDISNDDWIEWARPIWYGIKESDTLNRAEARSEEDDRHVCPLQLGTIERCVRLWSNPSETVFSPFAGIGSEGYVALRQGRKFIGCELKGLYARTAAKNLSRAESESKRATLFDRLKEAAS